MLHSDPPALRPHRSPVLPRVLVASAAGLVALLWLGMHVLGPRLLRHYDGFPALEAMPTETANARGVTADPVNVAMVGTEGEIQRAMRAVGWAPADTLSRASDLAIARSVLLNRPDSTAPVSSLYLFGRRQDLAFEQQVGPSARRRHHVRFWRAPGVAYEGRPVWIGDASFDASAGLSHRGFHPTHHIAPEIDDEREALAAALGASGQLAGTFRVTGIGVRTNARNAEGDRYVTDGELRVLVISPGNAPHPPPVDPGVPPLVALKDRWWRWQGHRR